MSKSKTESGLRKPRTPTGWLTEEQLQQRVDRLTAYLAELDEAREEALGQKDDLLVLLQNRKQRAAKRTQKSAPATKVG